MSERPATIQARRARRATAALLVACVAAGLSAAPAAAGTPVKRTVEVLDDFFSPTQLTVPRRSIIVWKWAADNSNTHDVQLRRRPRGVKRFRSDPAVSGARFRRRLRVRGRYRVICNFHPFTMRQTIRVTR